MSVMGTTDKFPHFMNRFADVSVKKKCFAGRFADRYVKSVPRFAVGHGAHVKGLGLFFTVA